MKTNIPRVMCFTEYISKDQVREAIKNCELAIIGRSDVIKIVDELEPQDLAPIIHAKWKRDLIRNNKGGCIYAKMICSNCRNDNLHDEYMPFWPNCGAKMDIIEE